MKRVLSLLLVLVLLMSLVTGCTKPADDGDKGTDAPQANDKGDDKGSEEPGQAGKVAKLGLGVVSSIGKSADAKEDAGALGQADVTVAAVGFDADGKVVSVTVDTAQTKVNFDADGKVTNRDEEIKTKHEKKEEYGMKDVSANIGIGKEWYEQMNAFQEWMVGKTVDEITGLKVKEVDENHKHVPDVAELTSSVTITVEGYLAAVEKAWDNAVEVENGETVGLAINTDISKSVDLEDDKNAKAQMNSTMTATAFDADGKVAGTIIDSIQIGVEFDKDGKVVTDKEAEFKTKHELKEDYNMKGVSADIGIGKEWYEQMNAFQDWMVGKTVEEIVGMEVKERDEAHQHVPDVAELTSSVTITVEDYLAVVEKASKQAK